MKRILLLLALTLAALSAAHGQEKIYCEIIGTQGVLSKKVAVKIDFGQQLGQFSENKLLDEKGQGIAFETMVDAMNHMSAQGWELEQAVCFTIGNASTAPVQIHWILSKPVVKNEETNKDSDPE